MLRTSAAVLLLMFGLAGNANTDASVPDLGRVLRVVGRFGMAHACPIAEDVVLTNAHVVDPRPFDPQIGLYGMRFETINGRTNGMLIPRVASTAEDIAVATVTSPVEPYPIAAEMPKLGDRLWWAEYDYSKSKYMLRPQIRSGEVVTSFAGIVLVNASAVNGSSGSCALNENSEVVGIISFGMMSDSGREVTIALVVVPPWLKPIPRIRQEIGLEVEEVK